MAQSILELTIPTESYTTIIDPIAGGYKITFRWYAANVTDVTLNPCVSYPSVSSVPNGSGGSTITITFDDGNPSLKIDSPVNRIQTLLAEDGKKTKRR